MTPVQLLTVSEDEAGLRLDRWLRQRFPQTTFGQLQKYLRTGQVRVDGRRVKGAVRLDTGQQVRVPPLAEPAPKRRTRPPSDAERRDLKDRILHIDDHVIVINKPSGLAVQGGSGQSRHLDGMLAGLQFKASEPPRLVHRLDKDTSGALVLGRTRRSTQWLSRAFREKTTRKIYWALVAGVPRPRTGVVRSRLAKQGGPFGDRVTVTEVGKFAETRYATVEAAAQRISWLALMPLTGRTHQLRAHCVELGMPIIGDGKYGGADVAMKTVFADRLHLHARELDLPHPAGGRLSVEAPLPPELAESWRALGFDLAAYEDPFADDA